MATRMSFKQWYEQLGQPVPLNMVPDALNISPQQVKAAVRQGKLRVFTFRTDNGKVYRMVPRVDLRLYNANPLMHRHLAAAFRQLMAA